MLSGGVLLHEAWAGQRLEVPRIGTSWLSFSSDLHKQVTKLRIASCPGKGIHQSCLLEVIEGGSMHMLHVVQLASGCL